MNNTFFRSCLVSLLIFLMYAPGLWSQSSLSFIQKAYEENNLSLARKSIDHYFLEHSGEVGLAAWILKGDIYARQGIAELEARKEKARENFRIARHAYQRGLEAPAAGLSGLDFGRAEYEERLLRLYKEILSEANGFYLQNELGWTIRAARWAATIKPEEEEAYEIAISTALEIRDYPCALKSIENALLQFPEKEKYLNLKRDCLSGMVNSRASEGAWKDVRDHLKQLVAIDPENGDYRFNLGMAHHKLGENQAAIAQLVHSTKLNPDDYLSYYYLAKIQYDEALALDSGEERTTLLQKANLYLQIAHHIHPRQPAINDLMGEVNRLLR